MQKKEREHRHKKKRKVFWFVKYVWKNYSVRNLIQTAIILLVVMTVVTTTIIWWEKGKPDRSIDNFGNAVYWFFTTATTCGYGDYLPKTGLSKTLAILSMWSGIILASMITATISSILVERKLREGKGLDTLNIKDHIVICGWNSNASNIIEGVNYASMETPPIVLVNELPEDKINEVLYKYREMEIKFVSGDYTLESALARANISKASSVIVLADTTRNDGRSPDERTILATLTIKDIEPSLKVCAEILNPDNEQHLRRAEVDDIIKSSEYTSALLAQAALSSGIPQVISEFLSFAHGNSLWKVEFPKEYVGRTFLDLMAYFREKKKSILIGIIAEAKTVSLEDMLSNDTSGIDAFIRKKFEEAGQDLASGRRKKGVSALINPPNEYVLTKEDRAIVVGKAGDLFG